MSTPQQYQHPPQAMYYAPVQLKPWSGSAIAGFVLSLLWGFGVLSLIGALISAFGVAETSGGVRRGRALAWWGLALGILGGAWLVWMLVAGLAGAIS